MKEKIFNSIAYLVLVLGLLITFLLWRSSEQNIQLKQQGFFKDLALKTQERLLGRVQTYVDAHQAGVGLFRTLNKVTQKQWHTFVHVLNINSSYPGINGLGYVVQVPKADSSQFVAQARQDVSADFRLSSWGEVPEAKDLFVIKYIEPQERNKKAFGFDMGSERIRRDALERARDTREPKISRKLTLVQDTTNQPAFLMFVPILNIDTLTGKMTSFKGWIYAPFIAKNFVEGVLKFELSEASQYFNIELYDGSEADPANLMYASWEPQATGKVLRHRATVPVLGNHWTFVITASEKFQDAHSHNFSWVILVAGVGVSFLLFLLLRNLAQTRQRALALAETMTHEYRKLNQELDQKVHERTSELAEKNKKLNLYTEHLKNAYEDLETKVKFRNLDLEKQIKRLKDENENLKGTQQ